MRRVAMFSARCAGQQQCGGVVGQLAAGVPEDVGVQALQRLIEIRASEQGGGAADRVEDSALSVPR